MQILSKILEIRYLVVQHEVPPPSGGVLQDVTCDTCFDPFTRGILHRCLGGVFLCFAGILLFDLVMLKASEQNGGEYET